MVEWIEPRKTIGIIGGDHHAYHLSLAAKRLGYKVGILTEEKNCLASHAADWMIEKPLSSESSFIELSMNSDVIIYASEDFDSGYVPTMQKIVPVPQGEQLLALTQDRILQKVFLESISINIAPYSTVLTMEDIQSSVASIGYPSVLKTNHVEEEYSGPIILHNDTDIQKAEPLLQRGAGVLEAWIPDDQKLVVNIVKDQYGNIINYRVSEIRYKNKAIYQAITPANIGNEVETEVNRIAESISDQFNFVGSLSVELLMTSSGSLYVNELTMQPHEALRYTDDFSALSHYEAQIKANIGLAVPEEVKIYSPAIVLPFYLEHLPKVYQQLQIKPTWKFTFYPIVEDQKTYEAGYITIPTEDIDKTLDLLNDVDLWSENNSSENN